MSNTFQDRDEFNRQSIAEKAISLIQSDIDISPMVIDGGWGTGKTEFCHKLINLMNGGETHHLIYVDAFKADHADEPLMTVLAEVIKVLPDDESKKSFITKAIPALRYGLKTIAKAGVSHLLRQDATDVVDNFDKEIQKAADKAIDSSVQSILKDHVKAEQNIKALQAALAEVAAQKPIVLFIDELDRCRPNFAVDMLEIIKHTFDVKGLSFVLITNTQQLKASINHCYGQTVNAQRYLDKFVKFTFTLPSEFLVNGNHKNDVSVAHYSQLIQKSSVLKTTTLDKDADFLFMSHVITVHQLSLREVETLIRYLEIYQTLSGNSALAENTIFGYKLLRLMGVALFCFDTALASSICKGRADAKELANFLGESSIATISEGPLYAEHPQVISTILGQECFYNSDMFKPKEGQHEAEWDELIRCYFRPGGFPPRKGQRSEIVIKAIDTLSFLG
jgi:hypothetical protein